MKQRNFISETHHDVATLHNLRIDTSLTRGIVDLETIRIIDAQDSEVLAVAVKDSTKVIATADAKRPPLEFIQVQPTAPPSRLSPNDFAYIVPPRSRIPNVYRPRIWKF